MNDCPHCSQPLTVYRAVEDGWTLRCVPCDIYFYVSDTELTEMGVRYVNVKRTVNGAHWPSGGVRLCTRCGLNGGRRLPATFTAILLEAGSKHRLPVAYCHDHEPEVT